MKPPWWAAVNRNKAAGLRHGFRSGLEEKIAKQLEAAGVPVLFELVHIKYLVPETLRTYTPDFELPNGILIESKGIWDATDRAKHLLVRAQYPDLDIRMVFYRSASPITKGSGTTLAMWADKHGITWADKLIPEEWLEEAGPKKKPQEVLKEGPYGKHRR